MNIWEVFCVDRCFLSFFFFYIYHLFICESESETVCASKGRGTESGRQADSTVSGEPKARLDPQTLKS